jgi:hypothetical protein
MFRVREPSGPDVSQLKNDTNEVLESDSKLDLKDVTVRKNNQVAMKQKGTN